MIVYVEFADYLLIAESILTDHVVRAVASSDLDQVAFRTWIAARCG